MSASEAAMQMKMLLEPEKVAEEAPVLGPAPQIAMTAIHVSRCMKNGMDMHDMTTRLILILLYIIITIIVIADVALP